MRVHIRRLPKPDYWWACNATSLGFHFYKMAVVVRFKR